MDLVYFIYGLSFVLMAVAIFVTRTTSSAYALANHVLLLGAFGAWHGLLEWTDLWRSLYGDQALLLLIRPWIMLASFLFLLEFGRRTLRDSSQSTGVMLRQALTPWTMYLALALCGGLAFGLTSQSATELDIVIRYFACIPACLLSGIGVVAYFKNKVAGSGVQAGGPAYATLSAALLSYGVLAGVVVPAAEWFPSSTFNQSQFQSLFGVPVQSLRTVCAVVIAWSTVSLLKLFRLEAEMGLRTALADATAGKRAIQAEHELLLMNQDLLRETEVAKSSTLAKSEFLASMSHEIRTPLSAISGMARLIGKEPLSTSQADKLRKLEIAVKHLSATINDVLDLSKIEANMLVLEQSPLHINQMFDAVAGMVQHKLDEKGLQLHVMVEPMPAGLLGDATRLGQALLNYLGNAVKFTHTGSIGLHASVVEDSADSVLVRLVVQDTGPGIAAETITRLFEPFVQANTTTARIYGGTGLGLAITKKLVQAMGGEVGVTSEVGIGTKFWFTARLLKDRTPPQTPQEVATLDPAHTLKTRYADRRVLLAEDDEFNREIGCILLQDVGLLVDVAQDGIAAVEMASRHRYDLILMDVQMPKLDGLEATRQIRAAPGGNAVPIIALTANAFYEDKLRCMEAGMDDFLAKPVDPLALYRVAVRLLQGPAITA